MRIIDNFLDAGDMEDLKNIVLGDQFPWYLNDGVSHAGDGHIQLTHLMFKDEKFVSSFTLGGLDIFKDKLGFDKIVRAKFNFLYSTEKIIEHAFHIDVKDPPKNQKTAILYLNTNNGYTTFENGEKVDSIENRIVIFDSTMPHSGSTCTNKKYRAVFNLNYIE